VLFAGAGLIPFAHMCILEDEALQDAARAEDARLKRNQRAYFLRPDIIEASAAPVRQILSEGRDGALIQLCRVDHTTLAVLLDNMSADLRAHLDGWVDARRRRRRVGAPNIFNARTVIVLGLAYLSTTAQQKYFEMTFGAMHSSISKYVRFSLEQLDEILARMPDAGVRVLTPAYAAQIHDVIVDTFGPPPVTCPVCCFIDGTRGNGLSAQRSAVGHKCTTRQTARESRSRPCVCR
jgi:hypothetical protein